MAVAYWYLDGNLDENKAGGVNLMVHPKHRGRGHGSRLARYLLDLGADPDRQQIRAAGLTTVTERSQKSEAMTRRRASDCYGTRRP